MECSSLFFCVLNFLLSGLFLRTSAKSFFVIVAIKDFFMRLLLSDMVVCKKQLIPGVGIS